MESLLNEINLETGLALVSILLVNLALKLKSETVSSYNSIYTSSNRVYLLQITKLQQLDNIFHLKPIETLKNGLPFKVSYNRDNNQNDYQSSKGVLR